MPQIQRDVSEMLILPPFSQRFLSLTFLKYEIVGLLTSESCSTFRLECISTSCRSKVHLLLHALCLRP